MIFHAVQKIVNEKIDPKKWTRLYGISAWAMQRAGWNFQSLENAGEDQRLWVFANSTEFMASQP